jgi:HemY protein
MRRLVGAVVVAALVGGAVFFADRPGKVAIVWQGWQIDTSVGVLVGAAALVAVALAAALSLLVALVRMPAALVRRRRERRRRAGYVALTRGMVAVAAGDAHEAARFARQADLLLAEPPLTLLLSAQVAQLDGDERAARNFFTAMLNRPETRFLGLRGLFNQARRDGDNAEALRLAEEARKLHPHTKWVVESLFDLQARAAQWQAARDTLAEAGKRRLFPDGVARRHRGVILHELSLAAEMEGDRRRAVALAAQAQALVPELAAPACRHARLLHTMGRDRLAAKAIERAWRNLPHPALAQAWTALQPDEAPLARLRRCERLASANPGARESQLMLAQAALDARLWGEARLHLERAELADPRGPTPRLCALRARLEDAEPGAAGNGRDWLDRAVAAPPDPRYVCSACAAESQEWHTLCPHCGGFDTLAWRLPLQAVLRSAAALPAPRTDGG